MPILPFIQDSEQNIVSIVDKAYNSGARFVYPMIGMTLRDGSREYFYEALDKDFHGVKERYIRRYGTRYQCMSPKSKELLKIFKAKCKEYNLLYRMEDIVAAYAKTNNQQISLF